MKVVGDKINICGFFEGYADFDPSSNTVAYNVGNGNGYVAQYDTAGNFNFVTHVASAELNFTNDLTLDPAGNIYIIGSTGSYCDSLVIGSLVEHSPNGNSNTAYDGYIAKLSNTGVAQWAFIYGGPLHDDGAGIVYSDDHIFCTGTFVTDLADFDPSTEVVHLPHAGGYDVYVTKYDLDGNYVCGFNIGSTYVDNGWSITSDAQNNVLVGGDFSYTVDFDPSVNVQDYTADQNGNGFVAKYMYVSNANLFTVTGDTICSGSNAMVTLIDTAGTGPFTIHIRDDSASHSYTNVQSGVPFLLSPAPVVTTNFTWSIDPGSAMCIGPAYSGSFTVVVDPQPTANAGPDDSVCAGMPLQLQGSGGGSYYWYPSSGLNNSGIYDPVFTGSNTTSIDLIVTNQYNCSDTDDVIITVHALPATPLITYSGGQLSTGTYVSYQWSLNGVPIPGANSSIYTPVSDGDYTVAVTDPNGCSATSGLTTVGVLQPDNDNSINLYPNANDGNFMLEGFVQTDNLELSTEILNSTGQLVYSSSTQLSEKNISMTINMQKYLAPGIYILKLQTDRVQYVLRFLKK